MLVALALFTFVLLTPQALCAAESVQKLQGHEGRRAADGTEVTVEITAAAEQLLDAKLTRGLLTLELDDARLSPFPDLSGQLHTPSLFFRITALEAGTVVVELWERGYRYGAREVSLQGGPRLRARRIALTARELGFRLRERRLVEYRRKLEEERAERALLQAALARARRGGAEFAAQAWFGAVGGEALWAGPRAEVHLPVSRRVLLGAALAVAAGEAEPRGGAVRLNLWDVSLGMVAPLALSDGLQLSLGARAAASLVHVAPGGAEPALAEWTARGTFEPGVSARIAEQHKLGATLEVGWLLRPLPLSASAAERLSGPFVGGVMAWTIGAAP